MKYVSDYIKEDQERIAKKLTMNGKIEGKREGKRDGKLEARLEFVKTMLNNGENIEKIMLYSKVSKAKIEKLREEMAV